MLDRWLMLSERFPGSLTSKTRTDGEAYFQRWEHVGGLQTEGA